MQVAGGDLKAFGEFPAAPVPGLGGHEGGDALPPGGRLGAGPGGVLAVGAGTGPAGRVDRRGGDGDADRGDGGDGAGAAVVAAEVLRRN